MLYTRLKRKASIFQGNQKSVDFDYFRKLAVEFYFSDDPSALGNFINGKLTYDSDSD